eukprot:464924_1
MATNSIFWSLYQYEVAGILGATSVFICIVVLIALCRKQLLKNGVNRRVVYLTNVSIGCLLLSMMFYTAINIMYIEKHLYSHEWRWTIRLTLYEMTLFPYILAQIFIYHLLITRLYVAFDGTKYAFSKYVYVIFIILIIGFLLCGIAGLISNFMVEEYFYTENSLHITDDVLTGTKSVYSFGMEIIDFIITAMLVILFIKRLLRVSVDISCNESYRFVDNESVVLNNEQKVLLNVVTKFFILTLFATMVTQFTMAILCVNKIIRATSAVHSEFFKVTHLIYWWLFAVDCVINSICLYLMPDLCDASYRNMCSGCDSYVRLCCKGVTKKSIKRKYTGINNTDISMQLL